MTGMPALTSASIVRAERTPPSTLTAWAPPSCEEAPGVLERLLDRHAVGQERHVADDERVPRAAHDGACVVEHLVHRCTRTVVS